MATSAQSWKPVRRKVTVVTNSGESSGASSREEMMSRPKMKRLGMKGDAKMCWKPVSYGLKWHEKNRHGKPVQREKFFRSPGQRAAFLKSRNHVGGVKVYNGKGSSNPTV
jgi:hypothetical protein